MRLGFLFGVALSPGQTPSLLRWQMSLTRTQGLTTLIIDSTLHHAPLHHVGASYITQAPHT